MLILIDYLSGKFKYKQLINHFFLKKHPLPVKTILTRKKSSFLVIFRIVSTRIQLAGVPVALGRKRSARLGFVWETPGRRSRWAPQRFPALAAHV